MEPEKSAAASREEPSQCLLCGQVEPSLGVRPLQECGPGRGAGEKAED